jgi:pimeloyl-ACP methyl ester carboxylesterase
MAPLARALSSDFRVLEPFQRCSGGSPLTVACHIEDLAEAIDALGATARPLLVGSSWGAMLALAFAAAHPDRTAGLVLIGCGTFDEDSRTEFKRELERRLDARAREKLAALETTVVDPDERLRAMIGVLMPVYCQDPVTLDLEDELIDARANEETWSDMLRLQRLGVYPAAFASINSPVLMMHGSADPHPGGLIRRSLEPYLPQLEYRAWEACGHYPWLERAVKEDFLATLMGWLHEVGSTAAATDAT